jgi:3-methyladenine DNA glycosylase Tag
METFDSFYQRALTNKGSVRQLEVLLPQAKSPKELVALTGDRYLSEMAKCIFRSGFVWKIVENKWPDFETVFYSFNPKVNAAMSDEKLEQLASDKRIIRHLKKIEAVRENARFIVNTAENRGSFGHLIAEWPDDDVVGLLVYLKKNGSRLGGHTGQYFLRFVGKDTFIFSQDVVRALVQAGVVVKEPTSQRDMLKAQEFFNSLRQESGRPLCQISRILAASVS